MKKRYYSFDVFDTCLSRLCGTPRNLYMLTNMNEENGIYSLRHGVIRASIIKQ